ncbi:MAG TPA: hypothetical protein VMT30_06645 [Candidatus Saccharimonadia bacterium]|nr:hypothetical protein [Candidatus Saccharimonadia bacterium]
MFALPGYAWLIACGVAVAALLIWTRIRCVALRRFGQDRLEEAADLQLYTEILFVLGAQFSSAESASGPGRRLELVDSSRTAQLRFLPPFTFRLEGTDSEAVRVQYVRRVGLVIVTCFTPTLCNDVANFLTANVGEEARYEVQLG